MLRLRLRYSRLLFKGALPVRTLVLRCCSLLCVLLRRGPGVLLLPLLLLLVLVHLALLCCSGLLEVCGVRSLVGVLLRVAGGGCCGHLLAVCVLRCPTVAVLLLVVVLLVLCCSCRV